MIKRRGRILVLAVIIAGVAGCESQPRRNPALYEPDPSVTAEWDTAVGLLEQGKRAEAVAPLRAVLGRSPRFVKAHLLYQDTMIGTGQRAEVESEYARNRERTGLALALFARVATRGSRAALLEDAVAREPDCPWTRFALGVERLRLLDLEPAKVQLRRARELDPKLAEAWMATAMLRMRRFDPAGSATATERYLAQCPLDAIHWFKLGCFHHSVGEVEEAVKAYRKAVRIRPETLTAAIRRRDVVVTEEQRRRFEASCSVGYAALLNVADIRIEERRIPRAIALLEQAVALDKDCPEAHYSLGIAYENLGLAETRRKDPASAARAANYLEQAGRHWRLYLELGGGQQERVRGWLDNLRRRDSDPFGGEGR